MSDRASRTSTSNFGVGKRESHDSTDFYARFQLPTLSADDELGEHPADLGDGCFLGDSRSMTIVPDGSVALVVTSPPYFAGKEYEEALGVGAIPGSYVEFLSMLRDVFSECTRTLEPGGRIAVNVANLGRKPYRSLSADIIRILQDDLKLLLRGEVIWQKGEGAAGSCAWGSFRSAANPVLRDITERIIIASKGRFSRAKSVQERAASGRPHENTLWSDEFMSATLDVWQIEPESARRVKHPAPFPVELPERLIQLYTYKGDLVLDPFLGSGSTLVAAARLGRKGIGFDLDPTYVEIARQRVAEANRDPVEPTTVKPTRRRTQTRPNSESAADGAANFQRRASQEGKAAQAIARQLLEDVGFEVLDGLVNKKLPGTGVTINLQCLDQLGHPWLFDVTGAFTTTRGGLLRTDSVWKCLGRAHAIQNKWNRSPKDGRATPLVFLTSHLPRRGSEGDVALRAAGPEAFFDAVEMLSETGWERLRHYAQTGASKPLVGFWTERDLQRLS